MFALAVLLVALESPQDSGSSPSGAELTAAEINQVVAEARSALERVKAALEVDDLIEARIEVARAIEILAPLPLGEGYDEAAEILWLLGFGAHGAGNLADAREAWGRVMSHRERTLPADHPDLLAARMNLAATMAELGELPGARALQEIVLEARERNLPEEFWLFLAARQSLAVTLFEMGDFTGARALEEAVLEAQVKLLPEDHPQLLLARGNLAVTMGQMGDLSGARALLETVLEAQQRLLPEDHPSLLSARQNLAITIGRMGDFAGARTLFEAVLRTRERILQEEHPLLLAARLNLSVTMKDMGDLAGARAIEEAVLEARERLLPEDHPDLLGVRQNLGITMSWMGDLSGARAQFEAVLEAQERFLPEDHPDLLTARQNLAITMKEMGDHAGARALAESLSRGLLQRLASLSVLSPREVREGATSDAGRLSIAAFLGESEESGGPSPLAYSLIETWRHVALVPVFAAATEVAPEQAGHRNQIQELRERLNDLVAGGAATNQSPEEYAEEVSRLSLERDRLERELRRKRGIRAGPIGPEQVSTSLPEGATSIGYRRLQGWRQNGETGRIEAIGDRLMAHVVRAGGPLMKFDLGAAADFDELVRNWRAALGKSVGRGVGFARKAASPEVAGAELAERLLIPILDELEESCTRLHICSDDVLFLVPFDALPLGDGRVGDRYEIVNEISFGRLIQPRPPPESDPGLLAIGGADFGAALDEMPTVAGVMSAPISSGGERSGSLSMFTPLEHTLAEVEAAARLFEENTGGEAIVLGGVNATKAAFHELAPGRRFLHLATHGWFAPETVPSMLDDQGTYDLWSRTSARDTVTGLAPSTLCGLAFAGANNGRDSLSRVPGLMTAEELMGIDLSACELAVLSACETNVGTRRAGQGIQSLQSALHAAGARTAITSLWRVDDAATRRLFETFYTKLWKDGLGKADALWQAKMVLRADGHPTRDWAAWVLTGDPE